MLVRFMEEDGSYIDDTNVDKKPNVGETIDVSSAYKILEMPGSGPRPAWQSARRYPASDRGQPDMPVPPCLQYGGRSQESLGVNAQISRQATHHK